MLNKIKKFCINAFCILLITTIWAISLTGSVEGGAKLNGFVAFILWAISIYVAVKFNAVVAVIGSFILEIFMHVTKYGMSEQILISVFAVLAMFLVFWKYDKIWSFFCNSFLGNGHNSNKKGKVYHKTKPVSKPQMSNYYTEEASSENNPMLDKEEREKEFYNIRSRDNSSDCPYICHQNSEGGRNPYYCSVMEREVSSNEYYHLCRYDWTALEECPIRKRYSKFN